MKIASVLANYKMAEADDLRKAMGKKIQSIMAKHRARFMGGTLENKIPSAKAKKIFDLIEKFGGYGFNKSHSAAYALIAFQTAYLKTHFPVEFMASLLTSEMHSTNGVVKYIAECRSHDIEILPPDIIESDKKFVVTGSKIRFGLVAVKNVGESAIEAIIEARSNGRFSSLFEFCEYVDLRRVNKRVIESLIKCGAFDSTGAKRSQMLASVEDALDYGQSVQKERNDPQMSLFDMGDNRQSINMPVLPSIEEFDERKRLAFEKESLGFYISGHPLNRYDELLAKFTNTNAVLINEIKDGGIVRIGGIISNTKVIKTKKGELMAFVMIEDMHGFVEAVVFSSVYALAGEQLFEDNPVIIEGRVQKDEKNTKIIAETIIPIDKAEETWTASIQFNLEMLRTDRKLLSELKDILIKHPGSSRAYILMRGDGDVETTIELPDDMKLKAGSSLTRDVKALLGYDAVSTVCSPVSSSLKNNNPNGSRRNGKFRKG